MRWLVAIFLALSALPSQATVLTDWQTGCQLIVPDEWRTTFTDPQFPGFGVRSYNPKDLTSVDFNVDDATTQEPVTEKTRSVQDFIAIFKDTSDITDQSRRTLNGSNFLVLSASPKAGTNTNRVTAWFTVVKGHACRIILGVKGQDPDKNDILNGIIKSFSITDHTQPHSTVLTKQAEQDEFLRNNPFSFYGKVQDENGQPVAGATVKMSVGGELGSNTGYTEHPLQSDSNGLFSLEGVHGMSVSVTVTKEGYYTLPAKHEGPWWWMARGFKPGTMPSKDQPAIFSLQKKGATEPLIVLKTRGSVTVPLDGTAIEFNLEKGRVVKGQPGTFKVQLWVEAHDPKSDQPYPWKCRMTVPGGGIQPRLNEYKFSAPASGYQEFMETEVTPGAGQWHDQSHQDCFVKLGDGKYARIRFTVRALGDFFIENGYLNPSGSNNLEFDPARRIEPGH